MSLGQLTANYTDSEGEDESDSHSTEEVSEELRHSDLWKRDRSRRGTPASITSGGSNTPQKRLNRLVSYATNEDDEEDHLDLQDEEPDEILNPEPMDIGTDDGDDDNKSGGYSNLGVILPAAPAAKCSAQLQDKISRLANEVKQGNKDYNAIYQNTKEFRNPSIYEKLIDHLHLDEMGSNYPLEMFDAHCWDKESFYDNLARVQKEQMDKREKERKEKMKVDLISGTKKPIEEEAKKRKSRFDQIVPHSGSVLQPTLTSVPTGTKPTIEAFGNLKKTK